MYRKNAAKPIRGKITVLSDTFGFGGSIRDSIGFLHL
jgi:hypothetical protein